MTFADDDQPMVMENEDYDPDIADDDMLVEEEGNGGGIDAAVVPMVTTTATNMHSTNDVNGGGDDYVVDMMDVENEDNYNAFGAVGGAGGGSGDVVTEEDYPEHESTSGLLRQQKEPFTSSSSSSSSWSVPQQRLQQSFPPLQIVAVPVDSLSLLECLPTDDMNVVLSYLTYKEFRHLSILSKRINDAVSRTSHLFVNTTTTTSATASSSAPNASPRLLLLQPHDHIRGLLQKYQSLNVLKLHSGCLLGEIGDDIISILNECACSNKLTTVSLHGCSLSYWCCTGSTQSLQLPNLQHLTLRGGSIRCTRIDTLLQPSIQYLQSLSIEQCSSLRDDTIEQLVHLLNNQQMKQRQRQVSCNRNGTRSFEARTGHHRRGNKDSQQQQVFQRLTLQQCIRIKNPVFDFPSLTYLNLVGCFCLQDLPKFNCPNLQDIDVSFCIRFTYKQIQQIIASCPQLKSLTMVKCTNVTKLNFFSQSLQHLNISFCNKLSDLRMDCPSLRHLENVSCCSLSTFIIDNAYNLKDLNLSQHNSMSTSSPVLKRLELRAPNLLKLNLEGCRRLDHCQISCPRLQQVNVRGSRIVALRFCKDIRQVLVKRWALCNNNPSSTTAQKDDDACGGGAAGPVAAGTCDGLNKATGVRPTTTMPLIAVPEKFQKNRT